MNNGPRYMSVEELQAKSDELADEIVSLSDQIFDFPGQLAPEGTFRWAQPGD